MNASRKKAAVRMFEQAVRIAVPKTDLDISGMTSGRLTKSLLAYVGRLKRLAADDPDDKFWPTLQRVILKLVKYVRNSAR